MDNKRKLTAITSLVVHLVLRRVPAIPFTSAKRDRKQFPLMNGPFHSTQSFSPLPLSLQSLRWVLFVIYWSHYVEIEVARFAEFSKNYDDDGLTRGDNFSSSNHHTNLIRGSQTECYVILSIYWTGRRVVANLCLKVEAVEPPSEYESTLSPLNMQIGSL